MHQIIHCKSNLNSHFMVRNYKLCPKLSWILGLNLSLKPTEQANKITSVVLSGVFNYFSLTNASRCDQQVARGAAPSIISAWLEQEWVSATLCSVSPQRCAPWGLSAACDTLMKLMKAAHTYSSLASVWRFFFFFFFFLPWGLNLFTVQTSRPAEETTQDVPWRKRNSTKASLWKWVTRPLVVPRELVFDEQQVVQ